MASALRTTSTNNPEKGSKMSVSNVGPSRRSLLGGLACLPAVTMLGACTSNRAPTGTGSSGGGLSPADISLAGINQWTTSPSDFGPAWAAQVKRFEAARPGTSLKTISLPIASGDQTIKTQLAAGTAPELVLGRQPPEPYMCLPLDDYLKAKNPFAPEYAQWVDAFIPEYYGFNNPVTANADGHLYSVSFNQTGWALYLNQDLLQKAGVSTKPEDLDTWGKFMAAVDKIKATGAAAVAMDNSGLGQGWTSGVVFDMLLDRYFDDWNHFDAKGNPGKNPYLTTKSLIWAIKTGKLKADLPEVTAALQFIKTFFMEAVTKNWSGIAGQGGAALGLGDFISGKAAMAWGTDFAFEQLKTATFKFATIPFPTITKADSPVSDGTPARFGGATGFSTAYMVPAKTSGAKLEAAIAFLQYMSAPKTVQPWIDDTGSLSALKDVKVPEVAKGFAAGEWAKVQRMSGLTITRILPGVPFKQIIDPWLLGQQELGAAQQALQKWWTDGAAATIKSNKWENEDWAK